MNDNPTVIRTGGKIVLVDTGMGAAAAVQPGATAGFLMRHLAAIGIGSGDVDIVIVSHFHGDHVNGLVAPGGGPAFPEAEITVPANEWSFWMDDGERTRASRGRMQDLVLPFPGRAYVDTVGDAYRAVPIAGVPGTPTADGIHTSE